LKKLWICALTFGLLLGAGGLGLIAGPASLVFAATGHAGKIAPPAFSDIAGHPAEAALTLLAGLGVYSGESGLGGRVKPDDPITRAQFCKVVAQGMGWGGAAGALAGLRPAFSDILPPWSWGFVNVAMYRGVINGYADGTFGANAPVTYSEAVTMLIRAVAGHAKQAESGSGGWPYNYLFYGLDTGFTGDVDCGFVKLPASRGDLARMMVATMRIAKLSKEGGSLPGTAALAGRVFEGVFKVFSSGNIEVGTTEIPVADLVYIVGGSGYSSLRNLKVRAVTNSAGDCLFIEVLETSRVMSGTFVNLGDSDSDGHKDCLVLAGGTKVPYTEETDGDNDVVDTTINQDEDLHESDLAEGDECLIVLGGNGLAVYVEALRFIAADWIEDFRASDPAARPIAPTRLHLRGLGDLSVPGACRVTVNGALADPDDLKIYDCVYVALMGDYGITSLSAPVSGAGIATVYGDPIAIRAVRRTVQGLVYGLSTTYPNAVQRVTLDNTGGGRQTYVFSSAGGAVFPSQGDTVTYGLDKDNVIFVPINFAVITPYVVVKAYTADGSGHRTATFDLRGTLVTYRLGPDPDAPTYDLHEEATAQAYGWIRINPVTGVLTQWTPQPVGGFAQVAAVDAARGTMTLRYWPGEPDDPHYDFIDDPSAVVYKIETGGGKTYIGIAGLHAGDWLMADSIPGGTVFEVTEAP
jgi:hypothetical protein